MEEQDQPDLSENEGKSPTSVASEAEVEETVEEEDKDEDEEEEIVEDYFNLEQQSQAASELDKTIIAGSDNESKSDEELQIITSEDETQTGRKECESSSQPKRTLNRDRANQTSILRQRFEINSFTENEFFSKTQCSPNKRSKDARSPTSPTAGTVKRKLAKPNYSDEK